MLLGYEVGELEDVAGREDWVAAVAAATVVFASCVKLAVAVLALALALGVPVQACSEKGFLGFKFGLLEDDGAVADVLELGFEGVA